MTPPSQQDFEALQEQLRLEKERSGELQSTVDRLNNVVNQEASPDFGNQDLWKTNDSVHGSIAIPVILKK
jgi:hypothetical protein